MRKVMLITIILIFGQCFIQAQSALNKIYTDVPLNASTIQDINNDNQVIIQIIPSADPSVPAEKKCTIITRLRDDMPTHLASFNYEQSNSIETLRIRVLSKVNNEGWIPFGNPFYGNGEYIQFIYKAY